MERDTELLKKTLVIPEKYDLERDLVAKTWESQGGRVARLGRFWDPPSSFLESPIAIYGPEVFCEVLAQQLKLKLCTPSDTLLLDVPERFVKRRIWSTCLSKLVSELFPVFVKPVQPKLFKASVYSTLTDLSRVCRGLGPDTALLLSEPVEFASEYRLFILKDKVLDQACYEGSSPVEGLAEFAYELATTVKRPKSIVIDVGWTPKGWSVVEFNATWGSGLNGCRPHFVLPAILEATDF